MPDARPNGDEPTAAFAELRNNLDYVRGLINGGQHLEHLQVGAFGVADLYRAAWVQAVSALDHWIHRELNSRALGFAMSPDIPRPNRFLKIEVPMGLFEGVHHHGRNIRSAFKEHLEAKFGYQSFHAPEKIRQALLHVSDADLWPSVAKQLGTKAGDVISTLDVIVKRRNKIAHETDRDLTKEHGRQPLSADEARQAADEIERIAGAIATVLGPPPGGDIATETELATGTKEITPTNELYRQFWSQFQPIARRRSWTNATAPPQNWWSLPAGVAGVSWVVSYAMFGCRSELNFQHPDADVNLARWKALADQRDHIEAEFGDPLIFDELPDKKACRIETRLLGPTIDEQEKWPDILRWMEETQVRLRTAIDAVGGVPK